MGALFASSRAGGESGRREFRGGRGEKAGAPLSPRHARGVSQRTRGGPSIALGRPARGGRRGQIADPRTGVAPGVTRSRNVRSRGRCSMCPAIHITSRSWLRSSSTHEPSDPPPRVVSRIEFRLFSREGSRERDGLATAGVFSVTHERDKRKKNQNRTPHRAGPTGALPRPPTIERLGRGAGALSDLPEPGLGPHALGVPGLSTASTGKAAGRALRLPRHRRRPPPTRRVREKEREVGGVVALVHRLRCFLPPSSSPTGFLVRSPRDGRPPRELA